jgi:hypothetical protein
MKMTIVTDSAGNIIGAVQGHQMSEKIGDVEATVSFEPGHQLHHVDMADDMSIINDAADYQRKLADHLAQNP